MRVLTEAVLRSPYVRDGADVVVVNPTPDVWAEGSFGPRPREVPRDVWEDFMAAHRRAGPSLPRDLDPGVPLEWSDQVKGAPRRAVSITLSPIGFSRDGRTAVVAATVMSAPLSGSNDYFILKRTANGWRLWKKHNISIA